MPLSGYFEKGVLMGKDTLIELRQAMQQEQPQVERVLSEQIASLLPLAKPIASHVLLAGGKRLRPLLCVLVGRALGGNSEDLYTLGCAVEMLHAATLLHDDILDNATERRSMPAAHTVFPEHNVILAGDALLAKALLMVSLLGNAQLTACISEAVMRTAEGELAEFSCLRNMDTSYETYLDIIIGKTAWMLRAPCELAAIVTHATAQQKEAMCTFGLELGIAFQMVDDALDFAPPEQTGKPMGGDLREGKLTPPLCFYLESLDIPQRNLLQSKIENNSLTEDECEAVCAAIVKEGFAHKTRKLAEAHLANAAQALAVLPDCFEKQCLQQMLIYIQTRSR